MLHLFIEECFFLDLQKKKIFLNPAYSSSFLVKLNSINLNLKTIFHSFYQSPII